MLSERVSEFGSVTQCHRGMWNLEGTARLFNIMKIILNHNGVGFPVIQYSSSGEKSRPMWSWDKS